MKLDMLPAVAGAIVGAMPDLLLRKDPETGHWLWKRTHMAWIKGDFATKAEAQADAERCGMPKPYRPVIVPNDRE
jgi:hypothetical protein